MHMVAGLGQDFKLVENTVLDKNKASTLALSPLRRSLIVL